MSNGQCSQTDEDTQMLLQPETRPISPEQLVKEVQEIYRRLIMIEKTCIEIQTQQVYNDRKLSPKLWQALIALQRSLLHEQHDFFLACRHRSASDDLRTLAHRHDLPGRLWRNGNKAFLDMLMHRIPDNAEYMISYVYLSFDMLKQLDANFPEFAECWVECMHDLERYRDFLQEIGATKSSGDKGLRPSCVAHQYLPDYLGKGDPSGGNGPLSSTASRTPQKAVRPYLRSFGGKEQINWLVGSGETDQRNAFGQSSLQSDYLGESIDDEINIQDEFDCWFGSLDPHIFDTEGKDKWVLLGWLHLGKQFARSFWSYRRVFKVLLLNVLL
ncbi:hypothetical protein AYL99_09553 [Fonsecaea erecta]|uniref:Uncharacterized protein n=1 Tax=Fonsecaea erecta TaxID=1367422 RepID=A0A178Z9B2_9EURO|nr:hypothetical protein AYL99_09553 [Fonsecaea erecta]OAP56374.1 hypothetical protein AYL99_09553 [Fonsecaea erecta]